MALISLSKDHISKALQKTKWDFGNKVLYDLCENYSNHKHINQIVAKIWLVGRSYAASIERRKKANEYKDSY